MRWQILDAAGKDGGHGGRSAAVGRSGWRRRLSRADANLPNPALWSPETPNLYSAIVTVESGGKAARRRARHALACATSRSMPTRDSFSMANRSRSRAPAIIRITPAWARRCPTACSGIRLARAERDGRQRRAHFAQHADAGVGGGLRPHGHDDDVRDAADELEPGRHGAAGGDGEALSQLAVDHSVVDGQRGVDA